MKFVLYQPGAKNIYFCIFTVYIQHRQYTRWQTEQVSLLSTFRQVTHSK